MIDDATVATTENAIRMLTDEAPAGLSEDAISRLRAAMREFMCATSLDCAMRVAVDIVWQEDDADHSATHHERIAALSVTSLADRLAIHKRVEKLDVDRVVWLNGLDAGEERELCEAYEGAKAREAARRQLRDACDAVSGARTRVTSESY